MTSKEEERPRFFTGGYGRHRRQWVKGVSPFCSLFFYSPNVTQPHPQVFLVNKSIYYMASSASGQDELNRARAGKMEHLACSGLPAVSRKQNFTKSHIINPLLTKFVRSRWLDIGLILFSEFMFVSVHKHAKKELGQYPAIFTSHLVSNPYILFSGLNLFPRVLSLPRDRERTLGKRLKHWSCTFGFNRTKLLKSLVFGQQQLSMVNCECGFNQSEKGNILNG